jgi:hypothetical protein
MKSYFLAALMAAMLVGCSNKPPAGSVESARDEGNPLSDTGTGNTAGTGMGAGGYGSGPTGTGGTQPADNEAVENNPD